MHELYGSVAYMEIVLKNRSIVMKLLPPVLIVLLAVADQLTKLLAVNCIKPLGSMPIVSINGTEWLNLTYCENTGMSFSLLEGQRIILIGVPVLLIAGVIWLIYAGKVQRTDRIVALSVLAGGGLGNLIDRVMLGYVVDFIDVRIINFAIFNFADICAVCGGIYFGATLLIEEIKEEREKKKSGTLPEEEKHDDA